MSIFSSACGYGLNSDISNPLRDKQADEGEVLLLCSPECAERGQCGTADNERLVLLNSDKPATFGHDMALTAGTRVSITESEVLNAIHLASSESISVTFYLANAGDHGSGWLAGWCTGQ